MPVRDKSWVGYVIAIAAGCVALDALTGTPGTAVQARATTRSPAPPRHLVARRLRPRPGALAPGTPIRSSDLFSDRVFANGSDGVSLASRGSAQYPARSVDGGRHWRIDGPQLHIDAADGPDGVGYVGVGGPRTFFAYGSSAVDVTTNAGRTWWETFLGELVVAVVRGPRHDLSRTFNSRPAVAAAAQHSRGNTYQLTVGATGRTAPRSADRPLGAISGRYRGRARISGAFRLIYAPIAP